jgi:hypothetical protein
MGKKILKYTFLFLVIIVGMIILSALMKALFIYGLYSFFLEKISSMFGLDMMWARLIAVFAIVATLLALPSIISFFLFGRKKKEVFLIVLVTTIVYFFGLYYGTASIFFDRATGQAAKYYIKTLDGFKFSSKGDFDPKFGIRFKPITPEVIKEHYFWQKTGKLENISEIKAGKYFDMLSGEPIVWYSERPNGEIKLFSLPGYDPMTGQLLKPINKEIVEVIEKRRIQEELERKRVEEENRKNKEKKEAQEELERKRVEEENRKNKEKKEREVIKDTPNTTKEAHNIEHKVVLSYKPAVFVGSSYDNNSFRIEIISVERINDSKLKFGMLVKSLIGSYRMILGEPAYIVDPDGNRYFLVDSENMSGEDYQFPMNVNIRSSMTFLAPPPTVKQISLIFKFKVASGYPANVIFKNLDLDTLKLIDQGTQE